MKRQSRNFNDLSWEVTMKQFQKKKCIKL